MKTCPFTKSYDGRRVLSMPEFEWETGKIYAVIGANGSGKSTLAKVLSGAERSDDRHAILSVGSIGYLPQKPYAFRMRVDKNLFLNGNDSQRAQQLLEALGLDRLRRKRAHRLSGGETAKLSLARLLMRDYALLILDEPTASMDMESTLAAESLICKYRDATDCTVILITHSLQQARRIADRVLYLEAGALEESGDIKPFLREPNTPSARRFLQFFGFDEQHQKEALYEVN